MGTFASVSLYDRGSTKPVSGRTVKVSSWPEGGPLETDPAVLTTDYYGATPEFSTVDPDVHAVRITAGPARRVIVSLERQMDAGTPIATIRGTVPTAADLPAAGDEPGDAWVTADDGHFWVWDGSVWTDAGAFRGSDAEVTDANVALAIGSATTAVLADEYARRTILPATRMRAWGHSFMAGVGPGVDAATQGMAALTAAELLLPLSNRAVGGTTLYNRTSAAAHWGIVLRDETRGRAFVPQGGFYPVMYGLNDINHLGQTYASQATFRMALRTVISRLRSAAIFENDDDSVTLGGSGTWATTTPGSGDARAYSGTNAAFNATAGGTITITTPADFPGGTLVLGFIAWTDGGATITGTVNGQTYSINTAATSRTESFTPSVLRIPDVPAGAGTYTFTTSSIVGAIGAIFDYWAWEPPEHLAPLVVLVGQPKPLDYTGYGAGGSGGPPTDAGVDALNQGQQDVAAEFGDRVVYVDCSGIDKDPAYWVAGNVHPTAAGHAYIADRIAAEVKARASFAAIDLSRAASTGGGGGSTPTPAEPEWIPYTPTLGGTGTSQGDGVWQFATSQRRGDVVHFMVRFLAGASTVIGSKVEVTLPYPMISAASAISLEAVAQKQGVGSFLIVPRAAASADRVELRYPTTTAQISLMTGTAPFTWAANDSFDVRGTYRAWPL